jgi:hypothetical protein
MAESPRPTVPSAVPSAAAGSAESVLIVPLGPVFAPIPDPSARHPDESADVEGYLVAPDRRVSVALASGGAEAQELLDAVWCALEDRGVAERRWTRTDEQGRTVAVVSFRVPVAEGVGELLRRSLVLPVRVRAGFAEVHLLADPNETRTLDRELRRLGVVPAAIAPSEGGRAVRDRGLSAEDWGLMGLLQAVGVFDPREAPRQSVVAEVIGVPPEYLDDRVKGIERGLSSLVSTLFAPVDEGERTAA